MTARIARRRAETHQAGAYQSENGAPRMERPGLARGISARIELQAAGKRFLQRRLLGRTEAPAPRGFFASTSMRSSMPR